MTSRTLAGLAVALVVLALLAWYGQRSDAPATQADRLLLPELGAALSDVDRFAVVTPGGTRAATIEQRDGDAWVVVEKDGYPANVGQLRAALLGLAEATIVEQKTANPDYYDRLGVAPIESQDATGVAVTAYAGDEALSTVIVGDSAGSGMHYVRRTDEPSSYLIDRALEVPRDAAQWVDTSIVDVSGDRIARITIEHPDGETVRMLKAAEGETNFTIEDVPDGRELQYAGVANVTGNALRELRLEDVEARRETDLEASPVRVTFETFDGLVVTVLGTERGDDDKWISLEAAVAERAAAAADGAAADGAAPAGGASTDTAGADEAEAGPGAAASEAGPDAAAQAMQINERVQSWRYKIPSYQFDQMTRRMEDLLAPPSE